MQLTSYFFPNRIEAKIRSKVVCTLSTGGHSDRVNCVRWIDDETFLSSSTDKSIIIWKEDKSPVNQYSFKPIIKLHGHSQSVTSADGIVLDDGSILVASASGDSTLKVWHCRYIDENDNLEMIDSQTIVFKGGSFALDVKMTIVPGLNGPVHSIIPNLLITVSMDNCNVIVYGNPCQPSSKKETMNFVAVHSLSGHDDWVQCIDVTHHHDTLWIATGGQDNLIKVWKISQLSLEKVQEEKKGVKDLLPNEEIKLTETIFSIAGNEFIQDKYFSVQIETILSGHEDKVFGLQWRNQIDKPNVDTQYLSLLSCSMDKTMIVWKQTEDDGVWSDSVRVGEVGGNTLGFLGCQFGPENKELLAYSFNGALHLWSYFSNDCLWKPGVAVGGHFSPVQDLDWEREGRYFVTVSLDQTTRVHAPWNTGDNVSCVSEEKDNLWHEIARPQVHGHDLFCVTMLPGHRMASGADEKIIRTFEATKIFLENLTKISKVNAEKGFLDGTIKSDNEEQAQGASVPSLGLSNKPILYTNEEGFVPRAPEEERHVKDQFPDFYFTPETYFVPPAEDSLIQNTLWPELHKLYGHGNEIFSVCSNPSGSLIASACKASKAEHADIILWDAKTWRVVQRLSGPTLTVTQIEFSPCGSYLLCVSRDRTWHLFKENKENQTDQHFIAVANTDKKTSIHQRLIWACSWSHDSNYFATGSRDKKIALWSKVENDVNSSSKTCLGEYGMVCKVPLVLESSITALAFTRQTCDNRSSKYLIAAGLETGKICFVLWDPNATTEEWKILKTLNSSDGHHKTVKRLKFRPKTVNEKEYILASCGEDNTVKLHRFRLK